MQTSFFLVAANIIEAAWVVETYPISLQHAEEILKTLYQFIADDRGSHQT